MKIQESAENYLETILILKERYSCVRSIDIVNEMNFTKPSVSIAMKNLRENGYITVDEYGYIEFCEKGIDIAKKVYEKHMVITKALSLIGVNEETARVDACKIEHDLSDESFSKIKEFIKNFGKYGKDLYL